MADENSGNWLTVFIVKFIKFDVIDSDDSRFLQISAAASDELNCEPWQLNSS